MHRRALLYLTLALLACGIGPRLSLLLPNAEPRLKLDFGRDLERACVSPDGRWVACLQKTPTTWLLGVVDTQGGPPIGPFEVPDPPARVRTFTWHSSSRYVAFGCFDQVNVIDTQQRTRRMHQANRMVRQVLFRGDLLLARADERVYLWNVQSAKRVLVLEAANLLHADLSADGKTLAAGCFGEGVRIVSVPSKRLIRHLANGLTPVMVSFCSDDRRLAAALRTGRPNEDHAALFESSSGRQIGHNIIQARLRGAAITPDGERLVLRSDNLVSVWEPAKSRQVSSRNLPGDLIDAISPDGKTIATVAPRGQVVELWDAETGQTLHYLPHTNRPSQVDFPDAETLQVVGFRYRLWALTPSPAAKLALSLLPDDKGTP